MALRIRNQVAFFGFCAALATAGCVDSNDSQRPEVGGGSSANVGGSTGTGGTKATVTGTHTGGQRTSVGGGSGTSTLTNVGGKSSTGGSSAIGGSANVSTAAIGGGGDTGAAGGSKGTGGDASAGGGGAGTGGNVGAGGDTTAGGGDTGAGGIQNRGGNSGNVGGSSTSDGGTTAGDTQAIGGALATGGVTATGGTTATGGIASGGAPMTGGTSGIGGVQTGGAPATGGTVATGGVATGGAATGGKSTTGGAATGGAATGGASTFECRDSADDALCGAGRLCIDKTCVIASCRSNGDCVSGICDTIAHTCNTVTCNNPEDCSTYSCTNHVCDTFAKSCLEMKQRGAPPGQYTLDTDGPGGMDSFVAYCPTVGSTLAPVGICQAEVGAPPACRSYLGATGYDFRGVEFDGPMADVGVLDVAGQVVTSNRDVLELADLSVLSSRVDNNTVEHYAKNGVLTQFGFGHTSPHGLTQLFDGRILVTGAADQVFSRSGTESVSLFSTSAALSAFGTQTISGEIWIPSVVTWKVYRFAQDGSTLGVLSNPGFVTSSDRLGPAGMVQLASGAIVVANGGDAVIGGSVAGRLVYFEPNLSQKTFSSAPKGTALNSDGSISPNSGNDCGAMLQLPNGQILLAIGASNKLLRLSADGEVLSTFNSSRFTASYGMAMDHRGRILVVDSSSWQVYVVTFPGCSSGTKDGAETDVDCGGPCTHKCGSGAGCDQNADCKSGKCKFNYCE